MSVVETSVRVRAASSELTLVAPRRSVTQHVKDIWRSRELLRQLIRRELKVRYQNSSLGFAWSLLNPALMMGVYTLIFSVILKSKVADFPIWLLSGQLVYICFSTALSGGAAAITGNSYLVAKVRFPREILPLAVIGSAVVNLLLQMVVLFGAVVAFGHRIDWSHLWLMVPAIAVMVILACALGIFFAAANVYARDIQHLLDVGLTLWFWLTPILLPWTDVKSKLGEHGISSTVLLLNPLTSIALAMQRAIYGTDAALKYHDNPTTWWYVRNLGIVGIVSLVLLGLAIRWFDKVEGNFVESI
jgi:ABC-2 type transport system permease protein